jgi:hypothetical protein
MSLGLEDVMNKASLVVFNFRLGFVGLGMFCLGLGYIWDDKGEGERDDEACWGTYGVGEGMLGG